MTSSETFFNSLASYSSEDEKLPPVEDWHPDYCGEIDILIKANGEWFHQGSLIKRANLFRLFSKLLVKEGENYFLVTPIEKMAIKVEWMPFVIQDFDCLSIDGKTTYVFYDNCGNNIKLQDLEQLSFSKFNQLELPIIRVRKNLYASFTRSSYYRLIEQAEVKEKDNKQQVCIESSGIKFYLGECE